MDGLGVELSLAFWASMCKALGSVPRKDIVKKATDNSQALFSAKLGDGDVLQSLT